MKTWKKSAIGVFNGKRFSIQMLVNKLKKLVIFSKKIKKKNTHAALVFNNHIMS